MNEVVDYNKEELKEFITNTISNTLNSFALKVMLALAASILAAGWWVATEIKDRPTTTEVRTLVSDIVDAKIDKFYAKLVEKNFSQLNYKLSQIAVKVGITERTLPSIEAIIKSKNKEIDRLKEENRKLLIENTELKTKKMTSKTEF